MRQASAKKLQPSWAHDANACPLQCKGSSVLVLPHHIALFRVQAFYADNTIKSQGICEVFEHLQSGWLQNKDKLYGPCQPWLNLQCHAPEDKGSTRFQEHPVTKAGWA